MDYESSLTDKHLMRVFSSLSESRFKARVLPSLDVATQCGNMYTASLYACLVSLVSNVGWDGVPKRVGLFSYGSGLISSMFSLRIMCQLRELAYNTPDYVPFTSTEDLEKGTYYLSRVNEKFEREYAVKT
ncbi:thiolase-like protein [Aspergillus heteromorphus CBS 117.55]|uniref:Thiolase-like protein n=1 Tax=Aspergillus heteromorphus CBS 117.55 TaxID=1448321 RepID=A0A317VNL7_9EURO|nr:thiolase-like protein [Aspergillus heteromorphus CBS 117.55]PWY75189.1 thiolase-like protein [Aspergillus heteromorphus CBS 117.55]